MKQIKIILILILITIITGFILTNIHVRYEFDSVRKDMIHRLNKRDYLDSLTYDHLRECSFVSKKEVRVDKRGYFYSTYHNNETAWE